MLLTGGMIALEDGKKAEADFAPPRKVRVELKFDIAADLDDAAVKSAIDAAQAEVEARVAALLAGKSVVQPVSSVPASEPAPMQLEPRVKPGRPKKTDPFAETAPKTKAAMAEALFGSADPVPATVASAPTVEIPDFLKRETPPSAVPEPPVSQISDSELNGACQLKHQRLGNPVPIRELIQTFGEPGQPMTLAKIPQKRRREFMDKLEKL